MKILALNLKKIEKLIHCPLQIKTQSHYVIRKEMKTLQLEHNWNSLRSNKKPQTIQAIKSMGAQGGCRELCLMGSFHDEKENIYSNWTVPPSLCCLNPRIKFVIHERYENLVPNDYMLIKISWNSNNIF